MITTRITERLGNQLFIMAAGLALAKRIGTEFVLHQDWSYQQFFKNTIRKEERFGMPKAVWHEPSFSYTEIPKKDQTVLNGYFQSERYFEDCKDYIRECFAPSKDVDIAMLSIRNTLNTVSVHIRRGDYVNLPNHHPCLTMDYYYEAMSHFPDDYVFIICSDDIEWCKQQDWKGKKVNFMTSSPQDYTPGPIIDLFMQESCNHNIISNSSFSWWGAWLNINTNKKVIAPKQWFGPAYANYHTDDLIPDEWIKI